MLPNEQELGDGGVEELSFNRKKPAAGSGRGSRLLHQLVGC